MIAEFPNISNLIWKELAEMIRIIAINADILINQNVPVRIKNHFTKRLVLRIFEIMEFFTLLLGFRYKVRMDLISYINSLKDKDFMICLITDRSRLGVKNIRGFIKDLKCDFVQIRGKLSKTEIIAPGQNIEGISCLIYESPFMRPEIKTLGKIISSQSLIIDSDEKFLKSAKKAGYKVFPTIGEYISDPESFTLLLQRRVQYYCS